MKLTEAIETLKDLKTQPYCHPEPDQQDAIQLGIEAIKREQQNRQYRSFYAPGLLPGETKE